MGHRFDGVTWQAPVDPAPWPEADRIHALLMDRTEVLSGCIEDSDVEYELRAIAEALEAYEAKRGPMAGCRREGIADARIREA